MPNQATVTKCLTCGCLLATGHEFCSDYCRDHQPNLVVRPEPSLPARKPVTAWSVEPLEENGDEFFVLTVHHGLGAMTRVDLDAVEVADLAAALTAALDA